MGTLPGAGFYVTNRFMPLLSALQNANIDLSNLTTTKMMVVLTAGTADERTFEIPESGGKGKGICARALPDALEPGLADKGKNSFITVDEIYVPVKDRVVSFAAARQKN
jgi:hypothetical protein